MVKNEFPNDPEGLPPPPNAPEAPEAPEAPDFFKEGSKSLAEKIKVSFLKTLRDNSNSERTEMQAAFATTLDSLEFSQELNELEGRLKSLQPELIKKELDIFAKKNTEFKVSLEKIKAELLRTNENLKAQNLQLKEKKTTKARLDNQLTRWMFYYDNDDPKLEKSQEEWGTYASSVAADIISLEQQIVKLESLALTTEKSLASTQQDVFKTFACMEACKEKMPGFSRSVAVKKEEEKLTADKKAIMEKPELANLIHYCYKADGTFGDYALEEIRNEMVKKGRASAPTAMISPDDMMAYLSTEINFRRFHPEKLLGIDPLEAMNKRQQENSSIATELVNLENYQYDEKGCKSDEPLNQVKMFFEHTLGYELGTDGLPKNFEADIKAGRISTVLINAIVGFDIRTPVPERKARAEAEQLAPKEKTVSFHTGTPSPTATATSSIPPPSTSRPAPPPPPPPKRP